MNIKIFISKGKEIEKEFARLAESKGWGVEFVDDKTNRLKHYDIIIRKARKSNTPLEFRIDVKDRKSLNRGEPKQDDWILLELFSKSHPGWLYGEAKYCIYNRRLKEQITWIEIHHVEEIAKGKWHHNK